MHRIDPAGARRQSRRRGLRAGGRRRPHRRRSGSSLFYLVEKISGYQLSILAIAVGFLVGRAVRWATGGRGGVIYQVLAVVLTYAAIAFSWLPFVAERQGAALDVVDVVLQAPFILSLPILIGLERPFTLVILGIGLWEAWKFTAPVPFVITGPFTAVPPPPDAPGPA